MSRYTGAKLKIIKRLGHLPGLNKTIKFTNKKVNKKKPSQYKVRLDTKQRLRFHYGITEKQLVRYIKRARTLKGSTGQLLLKLLEMRLDNVLFRCGVSSSIPAARQFINHGHVHVNKKKMDIPSYQCQIDDIISINETKSNHLNKESDRELNSSLIPSYLNLDKTLNQIKIINNFQYNEVGLTLNELLVIEYYSRS